METVDKLAPLGFGFMRLPLTNLDDPASIDIDKCCELVDLFMDAGFTYFDSARGYHGGKSEWALRKALVERYPRDSFTIATKLPAWLAENAEHARAMFDKSLRECGVDYFDYYLLHNLGESLTQGFEDFGLWEFCAEKKAEGKIKKFGFSIHDNAEELEKVLDAHPEVDFVQLQINYVDWESDIIQSRKCYEVCRSRGLLVVIMEPVKGGSLVKLPDPVAAVLREADADAPLASWALRFAGSLPGVIAVLSGMNTPEMVVENTAIMRDGAPLTDAEREVVARAREVLSGLPGVPCTDCRYCMKGCPQGVHINTIMQSLNIHDQMGDDYRAQENYNWNTGDGKASACIQCGACEEVCPQHIAIVSELERAVELFES